MVARRLLKSLAAGLAAAAALSPLHSQAPPQSAVPVPRWIRLAVAAEGARTWTAKARAAADDRAEQSPQQTARQVGDLAIASRELYRTNRVLLGSRQVPGPRPNLRFAVLDGAATAYDLYRGTITASEAGRNAVAIGASSAAGALTAGGMFWFAGAVGTASTGTDISSLSGAAFTSAATAYWGGGAVAAGGGGMAVGSAIITGGVVVAVAATSYAVYKVWNILDPAQREAMEILVNGLNGRGGPDRCQHALRGGPPGRAAAAAEGEMTRYRSGAPMPIRALQAISIPTITRFLPGQLRPWLRDATWRLWGTVLPVEKGHPPTGAARIKVLSSCGKLPLTGEA